MSGHRRKPGDGGEDVGEGVSCDKLELLAQEEARVLVPEDVLVLVAHQTPSGLSGVEGEVSERCFQLADDVVLAAAVPVPHGDQELAVESAAVHGTEHNLLEHRVSFVHVLLAAVDEVPRGVFDGDERVGFAEQVARSELVGSKDDASTVNGEFVHRLDSSGRLG